MSTFTEQYPDFSGLTFEKVWAAIQATDRQIAELKLDIAETERVMKESSKRVDEQLSRLGNRFSEATDQRIAELKKEMAEYERQRKEKNDEYEQQRKEKNDEYERQRKEKNDEYERQSKVRQKWVEDQIGRLGNRFGEVMEAVVRPGVAAKFNELGYQFPGESHNLLIKDPATGNRKTELDVILENGESVIVVEIKINPDIKDVKHFAEQLQYYREFRNRLNPNDSKKIYGALAAAVFPDNIQKAALDSGYYVIIPSGESIKIVFPEGFVPKAF